MKVYLVKRSFFTFRGVESYKMELCGEDTLSRMSNALGAEIAEEEGLPAGEKVVLYPVYPFLTRAELTHLFTSYEGSFSFSGGYVERVGTPYSVRANFDFPLFTLQDFSACEREAERRIALSYAGRGVLIEEGAVVSASAVLGEGAIVRRGARVLGGSIIGRNAEIGTGSEIVDSCVGEGSIVRASVLERARVGANCTVGPNAYLRPDAQVGDGCRIGDFVELKNCTVGRGTKISHLAYVGDADLGERVNVGCGVVFANYDGRHKHRSKVGNGCFLGSNCNLIAPVTLGDGVFLAAGTTLTKDLRDGDFCIGRCRETVKPQLAKKYLT